MKPRRLQRSRRKGYRTPEGAVYVGRPTKWGNPFTLGPELTAAQAAARYEQALLAGKLAVTVTDAQRELAGRDLVCWCKPGAPCHADVLLAIANRRAATKRG